MVNKKDKTEIIAKVLDPWVKQLSNYIYDAVNYSEDQNLFLELSGVTKEDYAEFFKSNKITIEPNDHQLNQLMNSSYSHIRNAEYQIKRKEELAIAAELRKKKAEEEKNKLRENKIRSELFFESLTDEQKKMFNKITKKPKGIK